MGGIRALKEVLGHVRAIVLVIRSSTVQTGKTIRGVAHLAFDAVDQVTGIVEGMYRNISATPLPFGAEPEGPARGIAGLVHESIRRINGGVREVSDLALEPLAGYLDELAPPGPQREAAVALVNGVCGDHLERAGNPLAIPLGFRVHRREDEPLSIDDAYASAAFEPSSRILVLAHGLCMNDRHWSWEGRDHGQMMAAHGYTPLYLRYNSGRHISSNGRDLDAALERVVRDWPVPVESIAILAFSMGGLVTRAALHAADRAESTWRRYVDKVVYIGTPHHGAALERGGFRLQQFVSFSPYTAPLAALGRMRSDGITDLRHGNVVDDDWRHHDAHADAADHRVAVPLRAENEHYAIAATLSAETSRPMAGLRSDGLVHPASGTGRHENPVMRLAFPENHLRLIYERGHLGLLHDREVARCLRGWLS